MNFRRNLNFVFVTVFLFLIAACGQSTVLPTKTIALEASPISITTNNTPQPFVTNTLAPTPTSTPQPSATFNFAPPLITRTLAPKAVCPTIDQSLPIDLNIYLDPFDRNSTYGEMEDALQLVESALAEYLSAGGTVNQIEEEFKWEENQLDPAYIGNVQVADITGDDVPEVFVWLALPLAEDTLPSPLTAKDFRKFFPMPIQQSGTTVFTCHQGSYSLLGYIYTPYAVNDNPIIIDLNADGVNEIVQPSFSFAGSGYGASVLILAWNGTEFESQIQGELREDWMSSFSEGYLSEKSGGRVRSGSYELLDIDNNGTTEVVISSNDFRGGQGCELLYRDTKMVIMWSGNRYLGFYWRTQPEYRIQAVWDGDHATEQGLFNAALKSYKSILEDETLKSWSIEYSDLFKPLCNHPDSSSIPENPVLDKNERTRLESYSLYRIMLLFVAQGKTEEAGEVYASLLQQANPNNENYVELASAFWDTFTISSDIIEACQAASAYAGIHQEEILYSLDRRTYGSLTPIYLPAEIICPFQ